MGWLDEKIGIDTPEELVLSILVIGTEVFAALMVFMQPEFQVSDLEVLWDNPFALFWLGRAGIKGFMNGKAPH